MAFVLFAGLKIEVRCRDCPTGRAKFVNTEISEMNETRTRVQTNILYLILGYNLCLQFSSDSIFVRCRFVDWLLIQRAVWA